MLRRTLISLARLTSLASLTFACTGSTLDVGDTNGSAGGNESRAGSGGGAGSGEAAAKAACADAVHGPAVPYGSPAELTALIARKWFLCDAGDGKKSVMRGGAGIELTADGRWFRLTVAEGGAFERLSGVENEGTWDVYGGVGGVDGKFYPPTDTTPTKISYVYVRTSTGAFTPTMFGVESSPSRIRTVEASSGTTSWFVPAD